MNRASKAALLLSLTNVGCVAEARATPGDGQIAKLEVGVPSSFAEIVKAQHAVVDIIYGGRRIGQTDVEFEPGKLTFQDIDGVLALIPDVTDRAVVRAALSAGNLDTHPELVCNPISNHTVCPHLDPAVAGIIFDQDNFRLELVVNPRFLSVRSAISQEYLPRPEATLALVDAVAGTVAGGRGGGVAFAIQNRAVLGDHDARLVSTLSYGNRAGLVGDVMAAQVDKPGVRYTAGMFWASDIDLVGRRKLVGVGVETQFDTRFDKDVLRGTPLVVSLSQRSRVDVLVDGRLVNSRTYDAGNQSVDTSALSDGAYEVVLHIQEVGGASREERRFFTKNAHIAPLGKTLWFFHGGMLADDKDGSFISLTRTGYVEAAAARRLNTHLALDGTLVVTNGKAIAEFGGYLILPTAQARLAVLGSTKGDAGVLIQLASSGTASFSYNVDIRRVCSHDGRPLVPAGGAGNVQFPSMTPGFQGTSDAAGTFTQAIADLHYHLARAQIGFSGFYRRDAHRATNYAIGPTVRWSIFQRRGLDISFDGNLSQSNRGKSAFAGLHLQLIRSHSAFTATAGAQTTVSDGQRKRSSTVGGIGGAWQDDSFLGGNVVVTGNVDHTPENDLAHARADIHGPLGAVAVDAVQRLNGGGGQYSLGLETTAIVSPEMLAIGGRDASDSVIAVRVNDAPEVSKFEILVNETPRGVVHGGETLPISVTPYRQYNVRIRPLGGELVHFDGGSRMVSVYPGNVAKLAWSAKPVFAMFGQIVWADGSPAADTDVLADDAIGHTDSNGYFQIETSLRGSLTLHRPNGKSCEVRLNSGKKLEGYMALGTLVCRSEHPFGSVQ